MDTGYIIYIIIALIFSGFFSGIEIAFVSSNKVRYELDKKKKGFTSSILEIFYKNSEVFISTMLVGNNIALVIYGILMSLLLEPSIAKIINNDAVIVVIQTIISTLIILVTAEFLPKTLFKINPNFSLNIFALPLFLIYIILWPVAIFTTFLAKRILKMLGVKMLKDKDARLITRVDLDFFIQKSIDDSTTEAPNDHEVKLFQNALDFSSLKVRDCMIPRTELTAVNIETSLSVLSNIFIETGYSKIPVYKGNIDNIIGYIHSSEMFKRPKEWTQKIITIPIVPETMSANKLMKQLLEKKKSIAAVVDEFGGTAGVITMEDLFEEIFGDFEDEHDNKFYVAKQIGEGEYELSGRLEIEKINELFDLEIPESDEYSTLAGFILHYYKTIPKLHDDLEIGNFKIKIMKIATARIDLVRLKIA